MLVCDLLTKKVNIGYVMCTLCYDYLYLACNQTSPLAHSTATITVLKRTSTPTVHTV